MVPVPHPISTEPRFPWDTWSELVGEKQGTANCQALLAPFSNFSEPQHSSLGKKMSFSVCVWRCQMACEVG